MAFTVLWVVMLAALLGASAFLSYLRLLLRRLAPVGSRKLFPPERQRRVAADRERVGVSLSALHGALMACFAAGITTLFFLRRPGHIGENFSGAVACVLIAVAVGDQLIPFLLVARHDEPETILARYLPLLRAVVFLALPLTFPVLISATIGRLLETGDERPGGGAAEGPQADIQELIEAGEQEGLIEEGEGELLQSVVKFGDKVVRDVMTPRPEIAAVEIGASIEDLRQLFREKRHSRCVVYSGQLDNVEGIVNIHDLTELPPEEQAKATVRSLVRPVLFVPEMKRTTELLKELQQSTTQMAIVIDEYGSVAGLVTIEDLVEEIVGDIRDEVEPHERDIVRESPRSYLVAGHTELAQLADRLHLRFEPGDYSTVAGLVLAHLGHVPVPGERVEKNGLSFEVIEANPRAVLRVRLRVPLAVATAAPGSRPSRPS